jgi:hypothetical protein
LPDSVARFIRQLDASGFERVGDEKSKSFGDRLITFERAPIEIRLIRDRGQWTADLIAEDWNDEARLNFPLFKGFATDEGPST